MVKDAGNQKDLDDVVDDVGNQKKDAWKKRRRAEDFLTVKGVLMKTPNNPWKVWIHGWLTS